MGKLRPSRVDDAVTDCPACGARDWKHEPLRHRITCEACGHVVKVEGWFAVADEGEADAAGAEAWRREQEREAERVLAAVAFPVVALAGVRERPALAGWGASGTEVDPGAPGRIHTVRLEQAGVHVASVARSGPRPPRDALRHALESVLWAQEAAPAAQGLSVPAEVLRMDERRRTVAAALAAAERSEHAFPVDGEPRAAELLRAGDAWAATFEHGPLHVSVGSAAAAPEAVSLATLRDPVADVDPVSPG